MSLAFFYYILKKTAGILICIGIAFLGLPLEAISSPEFVASSRPAYYAKVDGNRLLSLTIEPTQLGLDMNSENSIRSETNVYKPARYYFTGTTVPRTVLSHLKQVYRYDRRRDVPIVSSAGNWVIAEYFRANSHIPLVRFRLLGNHVQRQEQLDASGRARRIVLIGWASRNSTEDDGQSDDSVTLSDHPAWIRVLNVSETGKKTLVAIAWKARGAKATVIAGDEPPYADLDYGLPGGTKRWQSFNEFVNSQKIDLHAESLAGKFIR